MTDDIAFYVQHLKYKEQNKLIQAKFGMWMNDSELIIEFAGSFRAWYHRNSNKNAVLDANVISELTIPNVIYSDSYYRDKIIERLDLLEY